MSAAIDTFIGIEATADRSYPFTFAALDHELAVRAFGRGNIKDVFVFLAGQENALAGINSPMRTSKGILSREEIRKRLSPRSHLSGWANLRLVELELLERGIRVPRTPSTSEKSPRWMRLGFKLFEELARLGYRGYPHPSAHRQMFECQGEAAFWNLLGHAPLKDNTLEGNLQRQLVLALCGLPVPDAMRFFEEVTRHHLLNSRLPVEHLYSAQELNALAAAYTAWLAAHQPEAVIRIGHEGEGVVYLPKNAVSEPA